MIASYVRLRRRHPLVVQWIRQHRDCMRDRDDEARAG